MPIAAMVPIAPANGELSMVYEQEGFLGRGGNGGGDGGGGDWGGGGVDGAGRKTLTGTPSAMVTAGASSMVTPSALLICERGALCRATAADSTWLPPPSVSVATTVRTTLPAVALMVSEHPAGLLLSLRPLSLAASASTSASWVHSGFGGTEDKKHCSS